MARRWNFHRYNALMRHFALWGPPGYISAGIAVGFKPRPKQARVDQPDFEQFMQGLAPGGTG